MFREVKMKNPKPLSIYFNFTTTRAQYYMGNICTVVQSGAHIHRREREMRELREGGHKKVFEPKTQK